jgi:hypothetical protein
MRVGPHDDINGFYKKRKRDLNWGNCSILLCDILYHVIYNIPGVKQMQEDILGLPALRTIS